MKPLEPLKPFFSPKSLRKHKIYRSQQKGKAHQVSPMKCFLHHHYGEDSEYQQGDHFLDDLELEKIKSGGMAKAVCGYGETVFNERDQPADQNSFP